MYQYREAENNYIDTRGWLRLKGHTGPTGEPSLSTATKRKKERKEIFWDCGRSLGDSGGGTSDFAMPIDTLVATYISDKQPFPLVIHLAGTEFS